MKNFFKYWLPPIIWAAAIFTLSSIPDLRSGLLTFWDVVLRKTAHMLEYAILAALLARVGFSREQKGKIKIYAVVIFGVLIYALTDEWHQTYVPGRTGSIIDVLIDTAGGVIGALLHLRIRQQLKA